MPTITPKEIPSWSVLAVLAPSCPDRGPPGTILTAGATYLRIVLRFTFGEPDSSFRYPLECQCASIPVTSITSNVLLATHPVLSGRKEDGSFSMAGAAMTRTPSP
jgi:hypothetical protein